MRFANLEGRLVLVRDGGAVDLAAASDGRLPSAPDEALDRWDDVVRWAAGTNGAPVPFDHGHLRAPSPRPRQVFGIGLNYASHAAEADLTPPDFPTTFTKFPTCIASPGDTVTLPSAHVDWEVELVVVIGRRAHAVPEADAWSRVAGLTVGQDLSERVVQRQRPIPQFSLGKSFPGFGPIGPWLVTPDELADPDDLAISCTLNGEEMQAGRTSDLIFPVPKLVHLLSGVVPLMPGDLVFTGTPAGVGFTRTPPRFLRHGDELVSTIEGIGALRTRFRNLAATEARHEAPAV
jgi:2-keto-4-pentenoate hydratase/2-oxohepta-3-ene-1,7-dioic acid hydratase in catechol pathway